MDLLALGDALLLPEDDLALATVLRSPLFGFEDDDLFAVAWNRGRSSLRAALRRKASERPLFADAAARLDELAQIARRETPFGFYALLLGAGGMRGRILARLGAEANDSLDEFLNLALEYERRQTPSLQGFLTWLRDARAEVKRDMEIARDEVRVMTVHGAKGLEAPIVILADTNTPPAGPRPPRLLVANGAVIWAGRKDDDPPLAATARQAALNEAEHEYRRLLYVAMTRAADRLIICAAEGLRGILKRCWYELIQNALDSYLVEEEENGEKIWRYRRPGIAAMAKLAAPASSAEKTVPLPALPSWLREPAAAQAPRPAPLSPSSAFEEEIGRMASPAGTASERRKALARGRLVHRLMQSLPDIPPARRPDAANRFLTNAAADFAAAECAEVARQVLTILSDASFAQIFAPGSRAEVPIVGRIDRPGAGTCRGVRASGSALHRREYGRSSPTINPTAPFRLASKTCQSPMWRSLLSIAPCSRASILKRPCAPHCSSRPARVSSKCRGRRWMPRWRGFWRKLTLQ